MADARYFEEPEKFRPENFSPESKSERGPYPFMTFGHGPRNCIGMRFALLQLKMAIIRIVSNFKILPCAKTVDKLVMAPGSTSGQPIGGMWVKIEKRL